MGYYRGAETPERLKAAAAVVAVHAALAGMILTGLNVPTVTRAVERLQTFDITPDKPPPPPEPPPPVRQAQRAKEEEGAAGKKATPSPVVAPKPKIVIPAESPLPAAPIAGTGSAASAGAAAAGTGTGAGGSGSGTGGGGRGDYSGYTPAILVRNLSRSDYRQLAAGRMARGSASVSLMVDVNGGPGNCRISRSSGDHIVDAGLCRLITRRLRFRPARDAAGRPIQYSLQYVANWTL